MQAEHGERQCLDRARRPAALRDLWLQPSEGVYERIVKLAPDHGHAMGLLDIYEMTSDVQAEPPVVPDPQARVLTAALTYPHFRKFYETDPIRTSAVQAGRRLDEQ